MEYDRVKILQQAKEAIEKHKLFFIDDIIAYLPISRGTFYNWGFDKLDELKELLTKKPSGIEGIHAVESNANS